MKFRRVDDMRSQRLFMIPPKLDGAEGVLCFIPLDFSTLIYYITHMKTEQQNPAPVCIWEREYNARFGVCWHAWCGMYTEGNEPDKICHHCGKVVEVRNSGKRLTIED
jgi:hypothetical protein